MKDSDKAYQAIIKKLIYGALQCGQPVNEQILRDEIGVGKTPMREAFVRLVQERYFTALPHRGVFVTAVTTEQLNSIYNMRLALTPYLCECLIMNASEKKLDEAEAEMMRMIQQSQGIQTRENLAKVDFRFHRMMGELSENAFLDATLMRLEILSSIALMPRTANLYIKTVPVEEEYRMTFQYIRERNLEGLTGTLKKHLPFNILHF